MASIKPTYLSTSPASTVDIQTDKTACSRRRNETSHQHCTPHQKYMSSLMREFDPKDPANRNRTFEKMVTAANKKHLNPGEQSFHYYVDDDGEVHGFIAVGNINDKLPHIIISDTGAESSYTASMNQLTEFMDNLNIDTIREDMMQFQYIINESKEALKWVSLDDETEDPGVTD